VERAEGKESEKKWGRGRERGGIEKYVP